MPPITVKAPSRFSLSATILLTICPLSSKARSMFAVNCSGDSKPDKGTGGAAVTLFPGFSPDLSRFLAMKRSFVPLFPIGKI